MQASLQITYVYGVVLLIPTLRAVFHVYHALRVSLTAPDGNASVELSFLVILLSAFIEPA